MPMLTHSLNPQWIAETLNAKWSAPIAGEFSSVSIDSRETKPGALYIGVKTDTGHRQSYVPQAAAAGAIGAIVETSQPSNLPQLVVPDSLAALQKLAEEKRKLYKGTVIGLTGSSGKTCTKELLAYLLGSDCHKTQGNFNNHLGVPITILEAPLEAPFWVVEAGTNHFGEIAPLTKMIRPDAALLTMIGSAHLEFFKTREGIAEEKSVLLKAVGAEGIVAIHESDCVYPALRNLKAKTIVLSTHPLAPCSLPLTPSKGISGASPLIAAPRLNKKEGEIFSGLRPATPFAGADSKIKGRPENYSPFSMSMKDKQDSWELTLSSAQAQGAWGAAPFIDSPSPREGVGGWEAKFTLPLWTPGTVRNAALCLCLALKFGEKNGIKPELLQERLLTWQGVALRGQWLRLKNGNPKTRIYLDAYNSNPEALADSLWRFKRMSDGQKPRLYVIGSMGELGNHSDAMHKAAAAKILPREIDEVILMGPKAEKLKEGLLERLKNSSVGKIKKIEIVNDLGEIKERISNFEGDVFVKGSHSTGLHTLAESCEGIA